MTCRTCHGKHQTISYIDIELDSKAHTDSSMSSALVSLTLLRRLGLETWNMLWLGYLLKRMHNYNCSFYLCLLGSREFSELLYWGSDGTIGSYWKKRENPVKNKVTGKTSRLSQDSGNELDSGTSLLDFSSSDCWQPCVKRSPQNVALCKGG